MNEAQRVEQVRRAVEGDGDAFQVLVVEYHPRWYRAVGRASDGRLRPVLDPADILQDAYAAAWKVIRDCRIDGPDQFYRWLEKVALNTLRNHQRALRTRKRDVAREERGGSSSRISHGDLMDRLTGKGSTPSGHLARREREAAVLSSLARLTDDQRAVVQLRYRESLSSAEVGRRLGKTESAVNSTCARALRALRETMDSISKYLSA